MIHKKFTALTFALDFFFDYFIGNFVSSSVEPRVESLTSAESAFKMDTEEGHHDIVR